MYRNSNNLKTASKLIGDHESIIIHALQREDWPLAVKTLEERNEPFLFYKYSSALIPHVAGILCKAWAKCGNINPEELLPVMASATTRSLECRRSVLIYLKAVITDETSLAVHNLYFSLLCSVDVQSAESHVVQAGKFTAFFFYKIWKFSMWFFWECLVKIRQISRYFPETGQNILWNS